MFTRNLLVAGLLGAALTMPMMPQRADAQITQQGQGYLLRLKYTKGQVMKYTMTTSSPMMPQPIVMNMTMTVKDVKNGIATVETAVTARRTGAGSMEPQRTTQQVDSRGNIVKGGGSMASGATPTLPAGPVRVGQSWTGTVQGMQGVNMNARYTLTGIKTVGSRRVAEITMNMTGSMRMPGGSGAGAGQGSTMAGTGRLTLDLRDASLVNGSVNMNMTMTMPAREGGKPQPTTLRMTTNIVRN